MSEEFKNLGPEARPDDLSSLRRLEDELQRTGWRMEGRTPREWVAAFALPRPPDSEAETDPVNMVARIGLAAVPALVDTLYTERLAPRPKQDLRIRSRCLEALGLMEPAPTCVIPAILRTLRVLSPRVQRQALDMLAKLRPQPDGVLIRALLVCLASRHEPKTRLHAAHVLTQLNGPLPPEVRRAALERLGDSYQWVRWYALRILGQLPEWDDEVCVALTEQVILDDNNRIPALRLLARADPARAFPLLVEEIQKVEGSEANSKRMEAGLKALRLVEELGARGESLIPILGRLQGGAVIRAHVEAVVDGILRDQLYRSRPEPSPDPAGDERIARLLQEGLPPGEETPARALARWAEGFLPFGRELCVRMALAAARRVVALWDDKYPDDEGPRSGLIALEDWVVAPTEENAKQAVRLGNNVPSQMFCAPDAFSASWAITYATMCVTSKEPPEEWNPNGKPRHMPGGYLGSCLHAVCRALSGMAVITMSFGSSADSPPPLPPEQAAQEVVKAIRNELLPWLCGTWDPVKEPLRRRRELLAAAQG
ncbi:HEAT repeat domain-containing protein [Archangium lansingense]|uniref:HEAT repeat domain-containing protein n=1 Tax=Archangium lansingense TaxID=2995310 RepID=UPI003B7FCD29